MQCLVLSVVSGNHRVEEDLEIYSPRMEATLLVVSVIEIKTENSLKK
jgi:hypothetical protein